MACLISALIITSFAGALRLAWNEADLLLTLPLIILVAAAELWHLYRLLPHNHRHDETAILPSFGPGTILTITRGLLLALLGGLVLLPRPPSGWLAWLPASLYLCAAVVDYLDGIAARLSNHVTVLGQEYDLDLDALGILIAPLLGVLYGQLPIWYLLVSVARYLFMCGIWWLKRMGRPVDPLTTSPARRFLAGFQMGLCASVLMPVFSPPGTMIVATLFMIPFIVGFLRDWLVVSRSINSQSHRYQSMERYLNNVFIEWMPLPLRAVLLVLVLIYFLNGEIGNNIRSILLIGGGVLFASAGVIGRLAALFVLLGISFETHGQAFSPLQLAIVVVATILMLTGSGKGALWRPDESFLRVKAGSRKADS